MNLNPLEQINNLVATAKSSGRTPEAQAEAIRKAAQQFEAVLLNQLTSALNNTGASEDEDALFGSDGGSGLAKQMFSEQLATTMANSGGIGLSDIIMRQFGIDSSNKTSGKTKSLGGAMQAIKEIRANNSQAQNLAGDKNLSSLINTSAKSTYVPEVFTGNPDEAEIISTIEDRIASGDVDESVKNLMLDGKYLSSTRARIVPDYAVVPGEKPIIATGSSPVISAAVNFQMPVSGRVSSNFGTRFHPVDHKTKFHGGMDIAVPKGTPVGAAANGEVVFAGRKGGYGNLVIIRHPDGRESRYGHLDKINVAVGDPVSAGQNIAASGSTGKSTGPHLHFEIRENGKAVDPRKVLTKVLQTPADK